MVEAKFSQLHNFEIEDSLFLAFVTGNDACDILTKIEKECNVRFRITGKNVTIESQSRVNTDLIKTLLLEAWKEADFKRAIEVLELTNASDFQLYFKISPAEAALMQVNAKKLLRCADLLDFKTDAFGNVCLFGKNSSVMDVFNEVSEVVCNAAVAQKMQPEEANDLDGPCILSMRVSKKVLSNLFSTENPKMTELRKACPFFIESQSTLSDEADNRTGIPISIFTKSFKDAMKISEVICGEIDQVNGTKRKIIGEVKLQHGTHSLHYSVDLSPASRSCKKILVASEIQLIFWVHERDAPRIIGSHGVTKKRIQECSKCTVLLHTESKRRGLFPVEIIGPNIQKCVDTRHRIESFLMQTPPSASTKGQRRNYTPTGDQLLNFNNQETLGLPLQRRLVYVPDRVLSQQNFDHSFSPNSSFPQSLLKAYRGNDSMNKTVGAPKVQLQLVNSLFGAAESASFCN